MEEKNQNQNSGSSKLVIGGSIVVAGLIIAAAIFFGNRGSGTTPAESPSPDNSTTSNGLLIGEAPVLGKADAPYTIVEFADFQCPVCVQFSSLIEPQIRKEFVETNKAKVVLKTLTFIDSFDQYKQPLESQNAGIAGECAKQQGKFWQMHDAIFGAEEKEVAAGKNNENSGNLTRDFLMKTAQDIGLDMQKFTPCFDKGDVKSQLDQYMKDATAAMGNRVATPTVFINGQKLDNPFDIEQYRAIIK
jgi:protein-disulfide isomerase